MEHLTIGSEASISFIRHIVSVVSQCILIIYSGRDFTFGLLAQCLGATDLFWRLLGVHHLAKSCQIVCPIRSFTA